MKLFIDVGNSRVKVNSIVLDKSKYNFWNTLECKDYNKLSSFLKEFLQLNNPLEIWISSVVPSISELLTHFFQNEYNVLPIFLTSKTKTNLKLDIDTPSKLGPDLIALASFIANQCEDKNGIMINLGTATTIIYIDNYSFQGAIIAPGLELSINALLNSASLLTLKINDLIASKNYCGKNTIEALSIGSLNGHAQMIIGLVNQFPVNTKIFFSGGNANKIKKLLPYTYVEEATLLGLEIIANFNKKQK